MAWYDSCIERVSGVLGGEPIIKGTRISVLTVVEYWELYRSYARIAEALPGVPQECLKAAMAYYAEHKGEIEAYRRAEEESEGEARAEGIPNIFRLSA